MNDNKLDLLKFSLKGEETKSENKELLLNKFKGKYRGLICATMLLFSGGALERAGAGMKEIYTMDFEKEGSYSVLKPSFIKLPDNLLLRKLNGRKVSYGNASIIEVWGERILVTAKHCIEDDVNLMTSNAKKNKLQQFWWWVPAQDFYRTIMKRVLNTEADIFFEETKFYWSNYEIIIKKTWKIVENLEGIPIKDLYKWNILDLLWKNLSILWCFNRSKLDGKCIKLSWNLVSIWKKDGKCCWIFIVPANLIKELVPWNNVEDFCDGLSWSTISTDNNKVVWVFSGWMYEEDIGLLNLLVTFIPEEYRK